jgi:hypothetical protein
MAVVKNLYLVTLCSHTVIPLSDPVVSEGLLRMDAARACLDGLGFWYRFSPSTWMLATGKGLASIYEEMRQHLKDQDVLVVASFDDETMKFSLPKGVWAFLKGVPNQPQPPLQIELREPNMNNMLHELGNDGQD